MRQIIWSIGDMPHMSDSVRSGIFSEFHSDTIWRGARSAGSTPPRGAAIDPIGVSGLPGGAVEDVEVALLGRDHHRRRAAVVEQRRLAAEVIVPHVLRSPSGISSAACRW